MISGFLAGHRKIETSLINLQRKASLLSEITLWSKYLNVQVITSVLRDSKMSTYLYHSF